MEQPNWYHELPLPGSPAGIHAGFTSRGAVTEGDTYSGFNLCHYTGDDPDHVARCREELREATRARFLVVPRQTHSTNVSVITDPRNTHLEGVDALVTALPGVVIGVNTADCVPVVLADSVAKIIGVAHAGWRGAVNGIATKTVEEMTARGADPKSIVAAMGPCICQGCFEVGEEVAERFPEEVVLRQNGRRPHVDLPRFVALQLQESGIPASQIAMPAACTRCSPTLYFSARALGINSGRCFTFAWLE
ncbi:MAG: peptidoglycan editing factor PgeF [Bacteroidales bacterium]|nr:peptidoglycan editing factor PgeF [Bacteroidales bacterium]